MGGLIRQKNWQRQRARLLHDACAWMEQTMASERVPLKNAMREALGKLTGTLLCNGKYLRVSMTTLRRTWDQWRNGGRSADALLLNYSGGSRTVPTELIQDFQRRATLEGVLNMSAAIQPLRRDWEHNRPIPGIGTRDDYCLQRGLPLDSKPDFPCSTRSLYRWRPSVGERAAGVFGQSKLRAVTAYVDMDYSMLRKCELYTLDDVRLDILCVDEATGRVVEVTMYVMMEVSSRYIVGWVIKPSSAIKQEDVDELLAYSLQVEGFGIGVDYTTHIRFERGTLACSESAQIILEGGSGGRIKIHRTSMDGSIRWVGAPSDVSRGHAAGKAVIESYFRRLHIALMTLPGQRGNKYDNAPQNLGYNGADNFSPGSLAAEAQTLATIERASSGRLKLRLPMLYLREVRAAVRAAIDAHNHSPGHEYSGHSTFTQREVTPGVWEPAL